MAEAFFGADAGNDLGFGVDVDIPEPGVSFRDFASEVFYASRRAVAVVARVFSSFDELFNDDCGRAVGGIAHTEVDDIGAGLSFLELQRIDASEKIGRQTLDSGRRFNSEIAHRLFCCPSNFKIIGQFILRALFFKSF
jgi:hypothetical protein